MAVGSIPDTNDILLDSAATSHMFCEQRLFSSYASSTKNETVDNLNTTQTPECTKEKIKMKGSLLRSHQQPT
jgi:hypothetical protein